MSKTDRSTGGAVAMGRNIDSLMVSFLVFKTKRGSWLNLCSKKGIVSL